MIEIPNEYVTQNGGFQYNAYVGLIIGNSMLASGIDLFQYNAYVGLIGEDKKKQHLIWGFNITLMSVWFYSI